MPGLEEAITMYYILAAGLCAVLDKRWPGSMLGSADFVRCRSGLGLEFWSNGAYGAFLEEFLHLY